MTGSPIGMGKQARAGHAECRSEHKPIFQAIYHAANLLIPKYSQRLVLVDRAAPQAFLLGIILSFEIVTGMVRSASA
jgi:hypothetical protein